MAVVRSSTEPKVRPRTWRRRVFRWVIRLALVYVGVLLVMLALENWLLYPRTTAAEYWQPPPDTRIRDVEFESADDTLDRLERAGIGIHKIQLSTGLRLAEPSAESLRALAALPTAELERLAYLVYGKGRDIAAPRGIIKARAAFCRKRNANNALSASSGKNE